MIDYSSIIQRRYPGSMCTINAEDYDQITWLSNNPKPSKEELDALWTEVQTEIAQEVAEQEQQKRDTIDKLEALGISVDDLKGLFN